MALLPLVGGCGEDTSSRHVVVYVSTDEYVARPILDEFEEQTGIEVRLVGDSEAQKTTGLVQRLRAERDHPVADVFWSSEALQTVALADEGVLASHEDAGLDHWPTLLRDPDGRWFGFSPRPRVIVYSPERVPGLQLPRNWLDATDPRFADRVVMADPRFGTTGGHFAAMSSWWSAAGAPERYAEFLESLRANGVRVLPGGNAAVVDAVASGEADIGFTDADDVRAAQARGIQVELLYPVHGEGPGSGTFLMPNTVAIVEGAPHPEEAVALLHFLLSDTTARALASSVSGNIPTPPAVAAEFPGLVVDDPMRVDLGDAAGRYRDAVRQAVEVLRVRNAAP